MAELVETQKADTYYDMYLNTETARYLYRVLAIKEIYRDPEKYGFLISKEDLYKTIPVDYVTVSSTIDDLPAFAREQGINYRTLKELNPWLRNTKLTVKRGKEYEIALPVDR
jgi:hypothetical protein